MVCSAVWRFVGLGFFLRVALDNSIVEIFAGIIQLDIYDGRSYWTIVLDMNTGYLYWTSVVVLL